MLWPAEWRLGVDDPAFTISGTQERAKGFVRPDRLKRTGKLQCAPPEAFIVPNPLIPE